MSDVALIPVDLLDPHPSNPRRDLGDLVELADSIRAHGIRQNLLVVPTEGRYRVVIGHRRLAAARMAGLADVPAVVDTDLTDADQLELMLLENLQRADLSPIEEAAGYQELLDLGVKVTMIARRTGRAATTVRSRVALLGLPEEARELVHGRQATLEDAAAVLEFEGADEYSYLLDGLGTDSFDWRIRHARDQRKRSQQLAKIADKLRAAGATDADQDPSSTHKYIDNLTPGDKVPDLPTGAVFYMDKYSIGVYRPKTQAELDATDKSAAAAERKAKRDEAKRAEAAALEAERLAAWEARDEFVRGLLGRAKPTPAQLQAILADLMPYAVTSSGGGWGLSDWLELKGYGDALRGEIAREYPDLHPAWLLVVWAHVDTGQMSYTYPAAMARQEAVTLYGVLERLGYPVSDVERARLYPETGE